MAKLNVMIVDDEPIAQNIIELYCKKFSHLTIIAKCGDPLEAIEVIRQYKVDVIFLDINMPEMNGMDFVKTLVNPPKIIFTTAYSEFAVVSYEMNAIDYLVKPISFERFVMAMNKITVFSDGENVLTGNIDGAFTKSNFIFVRSEGKSKRLDLNDLIYIEGLKDYARFCTINEKITVHGNLKNTEANLLKHKVFIRVHKSYIVNSNHIKSFDSDGIELAGTKQTIPIGSSYLKDLEKLIEDKKY
jgi:DNA-binding LytR/AlgR family response regulator